jgi:xanthine dehydrogenase accessory factor
MSTVQRIAAVGRDWLQQDRRVVEALLVGVEGSAPFEAGATMLISDSGEIEGSITGGCVEAAVAGEAMSVLASGEPRRLTYGIADELAGEVGLMCGGTVEVFVHELREGAGTVELTALAAIESGRPVAVATLLEGADPGAKLALVDGEAIGSLGGPELLDHSVRRDAAGMLAQGLTGTRRYGADGAVLGAEVEVHIRSHAVAPAMLVFGAVDFSAAVARIGAEVGYAVSVCDPREPFLRGDRFAGAELVRAWPDEVFAGRELGPRDVVLVFTHDPKFDEPALRGALATEAGYIGALGSRQTAADRERRLLAAGVDPGELARIHAPCGLDIGGSTPEEVAISILAEVIAVRTGRSAHALVSGEGPIHPRAAQRAGKPS